MAGDKLLGFFRLFLCQLDFERRLHLKKQLGIVQQVRLDDILDGLALVFREVCPCKRCSKRGGLGGFRAATP